MKKKLTNMEQMFGEIFHDFLVESKNGCWDIIVWRLKIKEGKTGE